MFRMGEWSAVEGVEEERGGGNKKDQMKEKLLILRPSFFNRLIPCPSSIAILNVTLYPLFPASFQVHPHPLDRDVRAHERLPRAVRQSCHLAETSG